MEEYDIAIIGLGPAGSTLARLISPDYRVIAIDKKSTENNSAFKKPCGGLLAPDAQKVLAEQGLNLGKDILVDPQIFSVRTIDLDSGMTKYYKRAYLNMDRHKFDCWLMSLIPPNVEVLHNTVFRELTKLADGYMVSYRDAVGIQNIKARFVVGADGANSQIRKFAFPSSEIRQYLSIQQWFTERHAVPFYSCIFDSARTDCYSWSVSKDGYMIFGGAYPIKGGKNNFEEQKALLIRQGFIFGEALKTEACLVLRPATPGQFTTATDGIFLIGEAAGFISPSSLEGISYALKSGEMLANIFNDKKANPEQQYRKATKKLIYKLSGKLLKCPFMFNKNLRYMVMKSGLQTLGVTGEQPQNSCRQCKDESKN